MKPLALILIAACACSAGADVVRLRDGTRIEGKIRKTEAGWAVTADDGAIRHLRPDQVASVELTGSEPAPATASRALESLRRSAEALSDPASVVEKYERFIESQSDDNPALLDEARKDLALWQQRQRAGLVKYAGQWARPQELPKLHAQLVAQLQEAAGRITQGQYEEAETVLRRLLEDDARNPTAHYLRGVMQFERGQLPAARRAFETADHAAPDHPPTLNNLAVLRWRQNTHLAALGLLQQAGRLAPHNRAVLDNLAEALGSLPEEHRDKPAARKAYEQFLAADRGLQERMEQEGLHRWGSGWVTKEELEQLKEAERRVADKIAGLEEQFEKTREQVRHAEEEIESVERAMRRLESQSYGRDDKGRLVRRRLPGLYYELQDDHRELTAQRESLFGRLEELQQEAVRVRAEVPRPKYTGLLTLMGVEHAPVLTLPASATATTVPSSRSSTER